MIRVVVRKGKLYEATMELFLPDGSRHPRTPIVEYGSTCAHVMSETAMHVAGFIPFQPDAHAAAGDSDPAPSACDEEFRKQVEEAERAAYERGPILQSGNGSSCHLASDRTTEPDNGDEGG